MAAALLAFLILPLSAAAQDASAKSTTVPLEMRRSDRPADAKPGRVIVHPDPKSDAVVRQAERDAAEMERQVREDRLLREQTRRIPQRPDLGYDVYSGIQQRNLQRSPGR